MPQTLQNEEASIQSSIMHKFCDPKIRKYPLFLSTCTASVHRGWLMTIESPLYLEPKSKAKFKISKLAKLRLHFSD